MLQNPKLFGLQLHKLSLLFYTQFEKIILNTTTQGRTAVARLFVHRETPYTVRSMISLVRHLDVLTKLHRSITRGKDNGLLSRCSYVSTSASVSPRRKTQSTCTQEHLFQLARVQPYCYLASEVFILLVGERCSRGGSDGRQTFQR